MMEMQNLGRENPKRIEDARAVDFPFDDSASSTVGDLTPRKSVSVLRASRLARQRVRTALTAHQVSGNLGKKRGVNYQTAQ